MTQSAITPYVSVIVPAYNSALYIVAALNSVLEQTYRDFEIIVIDDGSTDETRAIAERYRDRGVRVIWQPNAGPTAARNRGLTIAKGKLIALLDSDDLWEPTYLETMVQFLALHPETSIAFPDVLYFGISKFAGRRFQEVYPPNVPITFSKLVRGVSHVCLDATLRREVFDRVGFFDEKIWSAGDFDFWLRALHAGCRIEPVEKVLVKYRRHSSSMSLGRVQPLLSGIQALEKWRGRQDLTEDENEAVEFALAEWQHSVNVARAIENIHRKQYSVAAECLRQAHAHTPNWRFQVSRVGLAIAPRIVRLVIGALRP
jgi:glycosyltransferase involved in cell wall biosynthesis